MQEEMQEKGRRFTKEKIKAMIIKKEDLNFGNADLSDLDLSDLSLMGANLQGTNLRGAHLEYAHSERANLQGAHLPGANLLDAILQGATDIALYGMRFTIDHERRRRELENVRQWIFFALGSLHGIGKD